MKKKSKVNWLKWRKSLQWIDLNEENGKNGWKKEEKLELDAAVALRLQTA